MGVQHKFALVFWKYICLAINFDKSLHNMLMFILEKPFEYLKKNLRSFHHIYVLGGIFLSSINCAIIASKLFSLTLVHLLAQPCFISDEIVFLEIKNCCYLFCYITSD